MRGVKAVSQNVAVSSSLFVLLEEFRRMVNDAIRIGLRENATSLKALSLRTYRQLEAYHVPSYYKLCAISAATGILRNHRREKRRNLKTTIPYADKLRLTTCYGFKIGEGRLRLPLGDRNYEYIPLNRHTAEVLSEPGISVRSVTLTPRTISVAFSKEIAETEPTGLIGIDRNLDNVTVADLNGASQRYDLSEAASIKAKYRIVKSHLRRNDVRVRRRVFGKYGRKQRDRVGQILHRVSKRIVADAKSKGFGIVMEKLTGLRKLYRKGNWQSKDYRAKMNGWGFYEFQRQIEYKAKWEGVKVIYVPPQGTSSVCAICGSRVTECAERKVWCPSHGLVDRDLNAAKNIAARGVRFAPIGQPIEAMVQEPQSGNPESRWLEA